MDVILQTARKSRKNAQQEIFENKSVLDLCGCIIKTRKSACGTSFLFSFDPKIDQTDKYFVRAKVYIILMISLTRSTLTK